MGGVGKTVGAGLGGMFGGLPGAFAGSKAGGMFGGGAGGAGGFYVDPGPRPEYNQYRSILGDGGLINKQDLNMKVGALGPGYQAFQDRALAAPGTSAWEQMAMNKQALEQQKAAQGAIESGQARSAEARGQLARRGGLSSGARERLAKGSMKDILMAQQGVGQAGQAARADIGLQGEQQRLAALGQLPGMEASRRGEETSAQQFNIQNALAQKAAEEQARILEYQEKMKAYAAAQQANAIGASGPGGGMLGMLTGGLLG